MEQLRIHKKVEPSSLVTGTAGRLMLLPMILLLGNLGLSVYDDSNSNHASSLTDPLPSTSAIVHQRDPMLSLAAGHEQADQELDLLFPELERIMSPLPDELVSPFYPLTSCFSSSSVSRFVCFCVFCIPPYILVLITTRAGWLVGCFCDTTGAMSAMQMKTQWLY